MQCRLRHVLLRPLCARARFAGPFPESHVGYGAVCRERWCVFVESGKCRCVCVQTDGLRADFSVEALRASEVIAV